MWQFGEVLATTEHEEATIIAEIDYSILEQRRFTFIQATIILHMFYLWLPVMSINHYEMLYCDLITQDKPPRD